MRWRRTICSRFICLATIGFLCGTLLFATVGCGVVVRNESDINVQRLAESWPPYQSPVVPGQLENFRAAVSSVEHRSNNPTPPRKLVPLIPIQRAEEWGLPETAMDSLGRIGAPAVPALIEALDHNDPTRRAQAAKVLARIGPEAKQSVTALVSALNDENETVRKAAARALGQIGPEAEDAVIPLLQIIEEASHRRPPASPVGSLEAFTEVREESDPGIMPASNIGPFNPDVELDPKPR